jgi:hypothetical protein
MRTAAKLGVLGLGVLLSARIVAGCTSSPGEGGYDAGGLDEVELPGPDATPGADTSTVLQEADGGDATLNTEDSGSPVPGDDGGSDTSTALGDGGDAGSEADANDGAVSESADASDGAVTSAVDAGDSSTSSVDASDAASSEDASDASLPPVDSGDDSGTEVDAADAATGTEDAGFDASAACATLAGGNPIQGVGATAAYSDGGFDQITYAYGTAPSGTGVAPLGDTVYFEAWTSPLGVVDSLYVMYEVNGGSAQSLPLTQGATINTPPNGVQGWGASLASQASGATVVWWVQGPDVCNAATNYYSNSGSNYAYTTQ